MWELHQLKNTLIWAVSVGILFLFRVIKNKTDTHLFKNVILDNLKLVAIIEFVVGVYTFSLFLELVIVPLMTILGAMTTLAKSDKKYYPVERALNGVMVMIGVILIIFTIYKMITNFGEFANEKTLFSFYIPPLLTMLYIPFVFPFMVITSYESFYIRLKYFIKDPNIRRYTKLYLPLKFHVRIKLLERWTRTLPFQDTTSKEGIKRSVEQIFNLVSVEKNPPKINMHEGWSPYAAKQFLIDEGLETGYYQPTVPEEWSASTQLVNIGDDLIPNNISYYIDGDETTAKSLKLMLNVNSLESSPIAHSKLLSSARTLLKAALGEDLSIDMESAIMKGENQVFKFGTFVATIEKNIWPLNRIGGYDVKFVLYRI